MAGKALSGDGRIVIFMVLGFLALAIWLSVSTIGQNDAYQPAYSSYTGDASGLLAIHELLVQRGHNVSRHMLSEHEYPADACVILADESTLNPFKMVVSPVEVKALELFLRDGGRLVLFCDEDMVLLREIADLLISEALADGTEQSTLNPAVRAMRSGKGQSGSSSTWRGSMDGRTYTVSGSLPPLLEGIDSLELADSWNGTDLDCSTLLALENAGGSPDFSQLVSYRSFGEGAILIVRRPEIVTNSWIDRADNHRLVLALIEGMAGERPILFDENIHGYHAQRMTAGSLLTKTPGGHLILLAILCIVILYLGLAIMPARIAAQPPTPRRQSAEMVLGQASLFQRAGFERVSLRHLVDGLRHELLKSHDFGRLPDDDELLVWAARNMPERWKMDEGLQHYLTQGEWKQGRSSLLRAAQSCDAMRGQIWRRAAG